MFLGEFTHAIDEKGRLTVPARFRDELASGCIVTRGFEKYLLIYTIESFTRLTIRTKSLSPTDPENRALLRLAFSGASEAALDKQGRVHIPPFLRTYAGLDAECVVVGVGDYIEVWNRVDWEEQLKQVNDPEANAKRFATLNLSLGVSEVADLPLILEKTREKPVRPHARKIGVSADTQAEQPAAPAAAKADAAEPQKAVEDEQPAEMKPAEEKPAEPAPEASAAPDGPPAPGAHLSP